MWLIRNITYSHKKIPKRQHHLNQDFKRYVQNTKCVNGIYISQNLAHCIERH